MMPRKWNAPTSAWGLRLLAAALAVPIWLTAPAAAQAKDKGAKEPHPGYVDIRSLAELAPPEGELVEVTLNKPMLKALSKAYARNNKLMAEFLRELHSIQAVVVSGPAYVSFRPGSKSPLSDEVQRLIDKMEEDGWERIARVREDTQTVTVYCHTDGDDINGLTVFVLDPDGEVIFANIAGKIELGKFPIVNQVLDIPGLGLGAEAIEKERAAHKDKAAGDSATDAERAGTNDATQDDQN